MGKKIDRLVFTVLFIILVYIFFVNAYENIPAACIMTLTVFSLFRSLTKRKHRGKHMTVLQAQRLLEQWAYGPDDNAEKHLRNLLSPPENSEMIYLPRHPSATLSINDVFGAWKKHRDVPQILLVCACYAETRTRTFAKTLENPRVEIYDSDRIIARIKRSNLNPPAFSDKKLRLRKFGETLASIPGRRSWQKNVLSGLGLFTIYWITANPSYLVLSMGMFLLAGISLRTTFR